MRCVGLVFVLGACDAVFGIAAVPDAGPGSDVAQPFVVTGTYNQHFLINTSDGRPLPQTAAPNLSQMSFVATLDNRQTRPIDFDDMGHFSFGRDADAQSYIFEARRPQYFAVEYQLSLAKLDIAERFAGRENRALVPPSTKATLMWSNRPMSAGDADELLTTGIWSRTALIPVQGASVYTSNVDWTAITTPGGAMGLLESNAHDDAWYAYYRSNGTYIQLDAWARAPNTSIAGGSNGIDFGPVTIAPSFPNCSQFSGDVHAVAQRIATVTGSTTAGWFGGTFYIPNAEFADLTGFPLAFTGTFGEVAIQSIPSFAQALTYANPYLDGEVRAVFAVSSVTKLPIVVVRADQKVPTTCVGDTPVDMSNIAIAGSIELDGKALDSNDQPLQFQPQTRVPITWTAGAERADYWIVHVYQVVPATPTPIDREVVQMVTLGHSVQLDTRKLANGTTYRVVVQAVVGYASASSGDFATFAPDAFAASTATPGTFVATVQ